ncbi:MAG TPA: lipopolysaccharide heptosyltransferase II [Rhizobiales bacterium]|nr:lipopolysaccharide heptosyltransferase II [Hyphomicrobiales bacterium]
MRANGPILVISLPAIGDFIRSHSAVCLISEQFPDRPIDVVTSSAAVPVAAFMPHVRRAWALDKRHLRLGLAARLKLARDLRAEGYGTAYLLTSTTKASLIPWLARIPERIGYPRELQFGLVNRFPRDWFLQLRTLGRRRKRMFEEMCDIATLGERKAPPEGWPRPCLVIPADRISAWRNSNGIDPSRPALALYTSGPGDIRAWPPERFAAIARDYARQGWSIWLLGSARERPVAPTIVAAVPGALDFTSTHRIEEALCQIAASTVFLGTDGGLAQAAGAIGVPSVLMFRATYSYEAGPVNDQATCLEPPLAVAGSIDSTEGITEVRVREALDAVVRRTVGDRRNAPLR